MERKKENKSPYRWNLLLKYQLIEIIVLWEGRLTTGILTRAFGIGRQQASKDINTYKDTVAPGNLVYDKHIKGYKPDTNFKPVLTKGSIDEYLQLINSRKDTTTHFSYMDIEQANTEVISSPARFLVPENIRPIIAATRDNYRLEIQYLSFSSGSEENRVITPHTLVYSGYRWHVRAHCEKHDDYRDFVLSRISTVPEPILPSEHSILEDEAWNTHITLKVIPDPRLSDFQQKIIAREYNMSDGILEISTRAALASYYLQYLRITPTLPEQTPEAQQLILDNYEQVRQWLF